MTAVYVCAQCRTELFDIDTKFDARCGFPSFWDSIGNAVKETVLTTYGRTRIQLLCSKCGQHLGHLFDHKTTPTGKRYCVIAEAIKIE
ncbi:MAG TPA: peptide-methionine (R)-S-oxide reductase [Chryseosolibacter sp.]|nr:peptide-methionine (R)-S-oxide reductase [Chryseosolibacter sp.]